MRDELKVFILYALAWFAWVPVIVFTGMLTFAEFKDGVYYVTDLNFIGWLLYTIIMTLALSDWVHKVVCKMYPGAVQCVGSSKRRRRLVWRRL